MLRVFSSIWGSKGSNRSYFSSVSYILNLWFAISLDFRSGNIYVPGPSLSMKGFGVISIGVWITGGRGGAVDGGGGVGGAGRGRGFGG
jgi:hypothetical protein